MSTDNALVVLGRRVYSVSASDCWEMSDGQLVRHVWWLRLHHWIRPIFVGLDQRDALTWVNAHDEDPWDDAYSEYGTWLVR